MTRMERSSSTSSANSHNPHENMSPALRIHRVLADRAYQSISSGLNLEQQGDLVSALSLFEQGVADLNKALQIKFVTELDTAKASSTNQKMRQNLKNVKERITELRKKCGGHASSSLNRQPSSSSIVPGTGSNKRPTSGGNSGSRHPPPSQKQTRSSSESKEMRDRVLDDVLVEKPNVTWQDIIGLEKAKSALREIVVLPHLRPELFTGLRQPAKGVLLFGPPGTGKTMLAKAVAHESNATFFSISASTLTSKYFGEGEKMVRSLFEAARKLQPSIVFIDEIDSILTERSESEHEASRRLKTEFLVQFDGVGSNAEDRILVLAATNRPFEIDEAALRRLVKRIYIPLPESETRDALVRHLLKDHQHNLSSRDFQKIVSWTQGYSGSDITALAREASLGPIRELGENLLSTPKERIRGMSLADFESALNTIRPSVSSGHLSQFEKWNRERGTTG